MLAGHLGRLGVGRSKTAIGLASVGLLDGADCVFRIVDGTRDHPKVGE